MGEYKTIAKEAMAQQIIEKSRFIARVKPVKSKEEAEEYIASIKKEYKDATHNVPAMVIGDRMQIQWASDDGEPQGTSGAPIVQMLVGEEITNIVVIVTRYFGGIKLGTGGLVRAYTSSAKKAVETAGIHHVKEMLAIKCEIDYSFLKPIQQKQSKETFQVDSIEYGEAVVITVLTRQDKEQETLNNLANITKGKCKVLSKEIKLV